MPSITLSSDPHALAYQDPGVTGAVPVVAFHGYPHPAFHHAGHVGTVQTVLRNVLKEVEYYEAQERFRTVFANTFGIFAHPLLTIRGDKFLYLWGMIFHEGARNKICTLISILPSPLSASSFSSSHINGWAWVSRVYEYPVYARFGECLSAGLLLPVLFLPIHYAQVC